MALKDAAAKAAAAGRDSLDPEFLARQSHLLRSAALAGSSANAAGRTRIEKKARALARRLTRRHDDYLRFARNLSVPFDNNAAEREIRMGKLRIKVSGCMRSMTGAEQFCAIRSYLATAAKHGTSALDALIRAAEGQLDRSRSWQSGVTGSLLLRDLWDLHAGDLFGNGRLWRTRE
jgi:transposase